MKNNSDIIFLQFLAEQQFRFEGSMLYIWFRFLIQIFWGNRFMDENFGVLERERNKERK